MKFYAKTFIQFALCGIVFAVTAALCSLIVLLTVKSSDWLILLFTAPVSAYIIATLFWALFTFNGKKVAIWKGTITGALTGSISHFFAWFLAIVCFYFWGVVASDGSPT